MENIEKLNKKRKVEKSQKNRYYACRNLYEIENISELALSIYMTITLHKKACQITP